MEYDDLVSFIGELLLSSQGSKMRPLIAAAVCIAVLYALDAYWFHGFYADNVARLISTIYRHWV